MIDPAPSPLAIERRGCVFVLSGDVDTNTAPLLASQLDDAEEERRVELDMAAVSFIDSTGLRVIITEHQRRRADQLELVLLRPSVPVARLLELTGLAPHLSVEPPLDP
jgi:anti-sigma B factor antagonist